MDNQEFDQHLPEVVQLNIVKEGSSFHVLCPHVDLSSTGKPLRVELEAERLPTSSMDGTILQMTQIDRSHPLFKEMLKQAEALKVLPERARPRKLVEILRAHIKYAYPWEIEVLSKTNPQLAERVRNVTKLRDESNIPLALSEVIDVGYGVCRHLAVAMIPLAEAAGMKASFCASHTGRIKNIIRKDNGQQLFKLYQVGQKADAHVWVELQTSDGEWIPTDPSTQLIGDNPLGLTTFKEAGYQSLMAFCNIDGLPQNVDLLDKDPDLEFLPGEKKHKGILKINAEPVLHQIPSPDSDELINEEIPTDYSGPLNILISSRPTSYSCLASIINIIPTGKTS